MSSAQSSATVLGIVTIGQAPRDDLVPEVAPLLGNCRIVQHGALNGLTPAQISALAPRPGQSVLTSRLADSTSAVFGHDQAMPLVQSAIERAESDGAQAIWIACSGEFPPMRHAVPLLFSDRLAQHAVAALADGSRLGVLRPLPAQLDEADRVWAAAVGGSVARVGASDPYTDGAAGAAAAVAGWVGAVDLVVLDCMGYSEAMRAAAAGSVGVPVLLVRSAAARVVGEMLAGRVGLD